MNWRSLIPDMPPATRALLATLVVVFIAVGVGGWFGLSLEPYVVLVTGQVDVATLLAWPLHVLYTPASNGLSFIFSLFVLGWMMGALEGRFGSARVWALTALVALGPGALAYGVGALLTLAFGAVPALITGSGPIVVAAAALGVYVVRHQPEVYLFGALRMTPTQLFGLLFGLALLNFVIRRSVPAFTEELAAIGTGVLYGRWLERGGSRPARPRVSQAKLRVVKGPGDRTLH